MEYKELNNNIIEFAKSNGAKDEKLREIIKESFCLHPDDQKRKDFWWNAKIRDPNNSKAGQTTPATLYCGMQTPSPPLISNNNNKTVDPSKKEIEDHVTAAISSFEDVCQQQQDDRPTKLSSFLASRLRNTGMLAPNCGMWCPYESPSYFPATAKEFSQTANFDIESFVTNSCAKIIGNDFKQQQQLVLNWIDPYCTKANDPNFRMKNCRKFLSSTPFCFVLERLSDEMKNKDLKKVETKLYEKWHEQLLIIMKKFVSIVGDSNLPDGDLATAVCMIASSKGGHEKLEACTKFLHVNDYLLHHFEQGQGEITCFTGQLHFIADELKEKICTTKLAQLNLKETEILKNYDRLSSLLQILKDGTNIPEIEAAVASRIEDFADVVAGARMCLCLCRLCPECTQKNQTCSSKVRCHVCVIMKELVIQHFWFPDPDEKKERRDKFRLFLLSHVAAAKRQFKRKHLLDNVAGLSAKQKNEVAANTAEEYDFRKALDERCGFVLSSRVDWLEKVLSVSYEVMNVDHPSTVVDKCQEPANRLRYLLNFGATQRRSSDFELLRENFESQQKFFINFITNFPHLFRKFLYARAKLLVRDPHQVLTDGDKIYKQLGIEHAYWRTADSDWNSAQAEDEWKVLKSLSTGAFDKGRFYLRLDATAEDAFASELESKSVVLYEQQQQFSKQFNQKIVDCQALSRSVGVTNNDGSLMKYPGAIEGDLSFAIDMILISLQRSGNTETVDRDDNNSDCDHEYPLFFKDDLHLGEKKEETRKALQEKINQFRKSKEGSNQKEYQCILVRSEGARSNRASCSNSHFPLGTWKLPELDEHGKVVIPEGTVRCDWTSQNRGRTKQHCLSEFDPSRIKARNEPLGKAFDQIHPPQSANIINFFWCEECGRVLEQSAATAIQSHLATCRAHLRKKRAPITGDMLRCPFVVHGVKTTKGGEYQCNDAKQFGSFVSLIRHCRKHHMTTSPPLPPKLQTLVGSEGGKAKSWIQDLVDRKVVGGDYAKKLVESGGGKIRSGKKKK